MGDFKSGVWVILLFLYFVLFIIIVNTVDGVTNSTTNDIDDTVTGFSTGYVCDAPRYRWNPSNGEYTEFKHGFLALLDCDNSIGVESQSRCESIGGCSWANTTDSDFWYWITFGIIGSETITKKCKGNMSFSGVNVTSHTGGDTVSPFIEPSYYFNSEEESINLCRHPVISLNSTACLLAGCTWTKYDYTNNLDNPSNILNTMGTIFAFRYDFGTTGTTSTLLNIFLVLIPLLMLIFGIYFSLPFLH